jgi:hypothetical protein
MPTNEATPTPEKPAITSLSSSSSPTNEMSVGTGGLSPLLLTGVMLVVAGGILLLVWRVRGQK